MAIDSKALVLKYLESVDPNIPLMEALKIIHSRIELGLKINETLAEKFKEWGIGAFVTCPECASPTILEFGACHWCGFHLLDSTQHNTGFTKAPEVEVVDEEVEAPKAKRGRKPKEEKTVTPIQVQMGNEPAAILNFGGKKIPEDTSNIPLVKKGKTVEVNKEVEVPSNSVVRDIKTLLDMAGVAALKETKGDDLKNINDMAKLGIDARKDCDGKLSLFRQAIVAALQAKAVVLENSIAKEVNPTPPKKDVKEKSDKKAKKDLKVVVVTDEDFIDEEDDVGELDTEITLDIDDDIESVDLEDIDVEDLSDEDFDLDD